MKFEGCAPKLRFPKLLKEGAWSGGGSNLPLDVKGSDGGGGWNGLKPAGPDPGGHGEGSINGGETGLSGVGNLLFLLLLLLLLLSFGNRVTPLNLSTRFLISKFLPGWQGRFLIKSLSEPFFSNLAP